MNERDVAILLYDAFVQNGGKPLSSDKEKQAFLDRFCTFAKLKPVSLVDADPIAIKICDLYNKMQPKILAELSAAAKFEKDARARMEGLVALFNKLAPPEIEKISLEKLALIISEPMPNITKKSTAPKQGA